MHPPNGTPEGRHLRLREIFLWAIEAGALGALIVAFTWWPWPTAAALIVAVFLISWWPTKAARARREGQEGGDAGEVLRAGDRPEVNGLPLPPLLVSLMASGRWRHPGDEALRAVIPFLDGPVDFLSVEYMRLVSRGSLADSPEASAIFHEARGSRSAAPIELPWLDVDLAVFIAFNRIAGDDLGIALDYRTSPEDPRVVACEWLWPDTGCIWREVSGTFTEFARRLELVGDA
jgi:hypothetical protein